MWLNGAVIIVKTLSCDWPAGRNFLVPAGRWLIPLSIAVARIQPNRKWKGGMIDRGILMRSFPDSVDDHSPDIFKGWQNLPGREVTKADHIWHYLNLGASHVQINSDKVTYVHVFGGNFFRNALLELRDRTVFQKPAKKPWSTGINRAIPG